MATFIRNVVICKGDVKGCAYNKVLVPVAKHFGLDGHGFGIASFAGFIKPTAMSHAAFRKVAYNPSMQRFPEMFILANTTTLHKGYIPDEIMPTFLNLATDDPERLSRRNLVAEVFLATGQDPHKDVKPFEAPSHVTPQDFNDAGKVLDMVSYNIFNMMFGLKLKKSELQMLSEWLANMNPIAVALSSGSPEKAARVKEINEYFFKAVGETAIGQQYITRCAEKKMDGEKRLKEMVLVLFFAGVGGTSVLTQSTFNAILRDQATLVPAWKKDPDAVLLEGARLYPPVGGHNPMKATKADVMDEIKYKSGRKTHNQIKEGDMFFSIMNTAHHDPAVFGGPDKDYEYAKKFIPGRENADRILTWGAELRDIKSCPTTAGCNAAPRPCPGVFLSYRVARDVISYFVDAGLKEKEL
jgi:hypothetical protein